MPIKTIGVQARELGRIRMGNRVPTDKGGQRPAKLDTLRFTSRSRDLIGLVADQLGGTPTEWADAPGEARQWDVVTEADAIDILLPSNPLSQWMELWTADGLQRRCDGEREFTRRSAQQPDGVTCLCPTDPDDRQAAAGKGEACRPTSRLQVLIPWLPDIGVWLLVTHGFYAAAELAGVQQLLATAAGDDRQLVDRGRGMVVPARLRLDQRTVKRPGEKPHHFAVPAVEVGAQLGRVLEALGHLDTGPAADLPGGADDRRAAIPAEVTDRRPPPDDPELDELIDRATDLGLEFNPVAVREYASTSPDHRAKSIERLHQEINAAAPPPPPPVEDVPF